MAPSTLRGARCNLQIVSPEKICEAVVNLVESTLQDRENGALERDAGAELLKPRDENGNRGVVWRGAEGGFPFVFVVELRGAVEGAGVFGDGVVEVGFELGAGG